jgi:hypothetical protein
MQLFDGKTYLKIDIANNFGLDKKTWKERIDWFDRHEPQLMEVLPQAAEPALYFAGVTAWQDIKAGKPSGYPISLDATSSGLQILAALTGDRKAAELCNVVNVIKTQKLDFSPEAEAERRDGYTVIYQAMLAVLGESAKITREKTKEAIMTALYGSRAVPKEVFGEGMLLKVFEDTMQSVAPAVWELNEAFIQMWNPNATINSWVLPDNFHVHVKVMSRVMESVHFMNKPYETFRTVNMPMDEGRSLGANTTHSIDGMIVREMVRRCNYDAAKVQALRDYMAYLADGNELAVLFDDDENADMVRTLWAHYEESGYLSARIIDHLNLHNLHLVQHSVILELLDSLPAKPFEVLAVHDCFRCLPNYGNDLRRQYTLQLQLIAKSKLLQSILCQILGRNVSIGKLDESLWQDIGLAEYALS